MTILIPALIAVLAAHTALAEQRENKAFNTVNGRTSTAAPAGPRIFTVTTPGGGASANTPAAGQAPAVTNAMIGGAPSDGGRAFIGAGRQVAARSSTGRAVHRGGKAFRVRGGRTVDGGGAGGATTTTTAGTEEAPPNYSKPGALIRTTGQQPKYEKAEDPRTHTTDAGEIVMNKRKAVDVGRGPSVQQGPKDTLPPPNPVAGGTGYTSGAAANSASPATVSSGHDNNGSGNNDRNIPGDTPDQKGNAKTTSLDDDPTGFNDAY
ncbi:MAG: hypothetical protein PHS14_10905 [Elusimicrobia bacterium]|nr:hypothetical protein [Elusimicrobiota bacterium]